MIKERMILRPAYQKNAITNAHVTEVCLHGFVTEASTIGIPVGKRPPRRITTSLGNGRPFECIEVVTCPDGNIISWEYRQEYWLNPDGGMYCSSLSIFND